ncbi:MAG: terpene cyclase/mutase family protein [Planctomycetota bacterium]|nr:terpene cyclase/mutase family protein [Planctomycetota bacterium]
MSGDVTLASLDDLPEPAPIAAFLEKGIGWLVEAQHPDGGWGAGSHARQQERDPHAIQTDPATTAFTALALIRAGHTPVLGEYREAVRRAVEYLVKVVDGYPREGPRITDRKGTQLQAKLGPLVDTLLTVQLLSRVLPELGDGDELRGRVDKALDRCLEKLQGSQKADGSWGGGGWAPVLQSSLGCSALELAQVAGKRIAPRFLDSARNYQKSNFSVSTGKAMATDAAGVELYAFAGSQRAAANEARAASFLIEDAKKVGDLARDAEVTTENLAAIGVGGGKARALYRAYAGNEAQVARLDDEAMLKGFGNNGGEEYLSYAMTSESLVIAGGEPFEKWNRKMRERLEKVQSPDGSWTGHHCITSPVFCTAAVVQCLTVDRDARLLRRISDIVVASAREAPKEAPKEAQGK